MAVRRLSDLICVEHQMSVVENPKPHGLNYNRWQGDVEKLSNRDRLCFDMDEALSKKPHDFSTVDDFSSFCESVEEVKLRRDSLQPKIVSAEHRMKKNKRWNSTLSKMQSSFNEFGAMPQQAENMGIRASGFLLFLSRCIYKGIACKRVKNVANARIVSLLQAY